MPLDDQIAQRQANFQAIRDLGVAAYPNAFDASDSVSALVERHGSDSGEVLDAIHRGLAAQKVTPPDTPGAPSS